MYDLRNPKQRARYLRATTRRRDSNFGAAERIIRAVFAKERKGMLAALPCVGKVDKAEWVKAFKRVWLLSGENAWRYSEETWGGAQATARGRQHKPTKAIRVFGLQYKQIPEWMRFVARYIDTNGAEQIKGIDETTKVAVKAALKEGIANEESIPDLAARISDLYDGFEGYRSTLIARSETVSAFNTASREQARGAGSTLDLMWISSQDDRVRPEHEEMDGVTVAYDQEFDCSDGTTMPGEAVNCRCTIGYAVPDEK